MAFSSMGYFSFWSLISVVFSTTGIHALHNATIPVSDMVKRYFEFCIALSVSCSIFYAFLFRPALLESHVLDHHDYNNHHTPPSPKRNKFVAKFYTGLFVTCVSPALASSVFYGYVKLPDKYDGWLGSMEFCMLVYNVWMLDYYVKLIFFGLKSPHNVRQILTAFSDHPMEIFSSHLCWIPLQGLLLIFLHETPIVNYINVASMVVIVYFCYAPYFKKLLVSPSMRRRLVRTSSMTAYAHDHQRIIEIACGMVANSLAQYYFGDQSVALMLAFLCLAVGWLGTLAIVQPKTDLGIFDFFVSTSMQCAVSLFGLHLYTLVALFVGISLMILKYEMETVVQKHFVGAMKRWEEQEEDVSQRRFRLEV